MSWSVDWHNEATPTRNIGTVLLYPVSRFQFLGFDSGPIWTTGFIMRGPFGLLTPPADPTHGNRMGEVWGVTAIPKGSVIIVR